MQELALALRGHAQLVGELLDHVADTRDGGVHDERVAAAGAQRADAQRQRARTGLEGHVDGPVQHVRGRAGGDQVGDQHRVVEAVQRQVGARGEHPDDAAQDRADERAGGDRDGRRRVRAHRLGRHAASPRAVPGERHRHSAATARNGLKLHLVGDRRDQRQAEARAGRVRAGADAAAVIGDDDAHGSSVGRIEISTGPGRSGG